MTLPQETLWTPKVAPYVRPMMAEVREVPWNGLTAVGSFSGCGGSSLGLRMAGWRVDAAVEFVPAAADSYRANFPGTHVFQQDIRELKAEDVLARIGLGVGELDLFEGSPPCFPAGTLIQTERGLVPIEEVGEGMSVLTHEGRWRSVTETCRRRYYGRLVRLDLKYRSEPLACTTGHPLLVRRRIALRPRRFGQPEWVAAADVRAGDALLVPATKEVLKPPTFDVETVEGRRDRHGEGLATRLLVRRANRLDLGSPAVARVLGFYLAEGWRRGRVADATQRGPTRREVIFAVAPAEVEHAEQLLREAGMRTALTSQTGLTALKVHVPSVDLWEVCGDCGDGAAYKRLPEWVFGMGQEWREALLEEYLRGDGHVAADGRRLVGTVSRELATGVMRLISQTYGVIASLKRRPGRPWAIDGRSGLSRDTWTVSWSPGSDVTGRAAGFTDQWGAWIPVQTVSDAGLVDYVYNLEVDEDHSYVAGTVAAHNCASFSAAGNREKAWGQVKKYSDTKQRTDDLFWEWARVLEGLMPRAFIAENVPGLAMGGAVSEYAHKITKLLGELGYRVDARVLNAANYGVPQERRRLIFVGIRSDQPTWSWSWPAPTVEEPHTTRQALDSVNPEDPDHAPFVAESSMEPYAVGHTWKALVQRGARREAHGDRDAIPPLEDFCRHCGEKLEDHPEITKRDNRYRVLEAKCADGHVAEITKDYFMFQLPSLDAPCPTLTATGSSAWVASVVHPTECRKMTPAEAKAMCGFPADFVLTGTRAQRYERMGRAVPPPLYAAVGRRLAEVLGGR